MTNPECFSTGLVLPFTEVDESEIKTPQFGLCLRRFQIRNLKWEPKSFESGGFCRVNYFLSNPDIFPPANF